MKISTSAALFNGLVGALLCSLSVQAMTCDKPLIDFSLAEEYSNWVIINDSVMGGISSSQMIRVPFEQSDHASGTTQASSSYLAQFSGDLSLERNGGFASVRRTPQNLSLSNDETLKIRLLGDGRRYQFRLRVDGRWDGIAYTSEFATFQDQWLTLAFGKQDFIPVFRGRRVLDAPALDMTQVRQLGFMLADKNPGPFTLKLHSICTQAG